MLNILNIPAECFPTQQSFLEEVYTRNNDLFKSFFLMGSGNTNHKSPVLWNNTKVYLLSQPQNPLFTSFIRYFMDLRYLFTIPRIVVHENIHIIQIRDMSFPLFVALLLRKFLKVKVVYQKSHPHEMQLSDKSMLRAYRLPRLIYITKSLNKVILHKIMMKRCDAVLPISEYMKEKLNNKYDIPVDKMFPFGLGINVENLMEINGAKSVVKKTNGIRLIYVGTLGRSRKLEKMFNAIKFALNNHTISLIVVGGKESYEISRLEHFVKKIGIENIVHFCGEIDRLEVYKLINSCDIGLSYVPNSKKFVDSCPTKLIEYLAIGIPVIATDCVLLQKKILEETGAGVLASDGQEDFAEKLSYLINNLEQYKKKAENARSYIYENFNYRDMKYRLSRIYKQIHNVE